MAIAMRVLPQEQTVEFDTENVDLTLFTRISDLINLYVDKQAFDYLDVGGGNGKFADKILENHPLSHVTLVEPEYSLLSKNTVCPRKCLIYSTFQESAPSRHRYDVVGFNWVLHNFVGDSYQRSVRLQKDGLARAYDALQPGGIILILENYYDGSFIDDLSGRLIYALTAAKSLRNFTSRMGANTAGVGVCFHSERTWKSLIRGAGFEFVCAEDLYDYSKLSMWQKHVLFIARQRVGVLIGRKPNYTVNE
ncbi:hypothetical protein A9Q99_19455 [Gammaproteobacteria bacterium 45_16_T64]|nr:hypothetical protein A9Q99_19455 [Gammaproteobacteria bacterium 45_16_T64]